MVIVIYAFVGLKKTFAFRWGTPRFFTGDLLRTTALEKSANWALFS